MDREHTLLFFHLVNRLYYKLVNSIPRNETSQINFLNVLSSINRYVMWEFFYIFLSRSGLVSVLKLHLFVCVRKVSKCIIFFCSSIVKLSRYHLILVIHSTSFQLLRIKTENTCGAILKSIHFWWFFWGHIFGYRNTVCGRVFLLFGHGFVIVIRDIWVKNEAITFP